MTNERAHKVVWSLHGRNDVPGVVERKITSDTEAAGRTVKASPEEDGDYEQMRNARRHLAQGGPKEDAEHSKWRYSPMNWGRDPLKA